MFKKEDIYRLNERFIKDYRVNIDKGIAYTDYFLERLEQYDLYVPGSIKKYNYFIEELTESFSDIEKYYVYRNSIAEKIITTLCNNENIFGFSGNEGSKKIKKNYNFNQYNIPSNGCCKDNLLKKDLISVDLKSANFTALKTFDIKIVNGKNSYDSFIEGFTNLNHLIESKYFRQRVMGKAGVSNQVIIEKYLISVILENLKDLIGLDNMVSFNSDELIFYKPDNLDKMILIIKNICNDLNFEVHIEEFKLYKIEGIKDAYLKIGKDILDNSLVNSIYGVSPILFPFVLSKIYDNEIKDSYFYFRNTEGYLSKMIDVPKIEIKY